ncbi:MAG TPA: bifunctional adenosylmethionine decarboxylase/class I SAM-dependent methyltransferase [Candidatus Magasanikbacteria bacterium]|nr:bifunctional adenosylmethionine decarboxylase/class I SAM-dependent methyltransferase [Candidatus Magasanikbacteria bacterium]
MANQSFTSRRFHFVVDAFDCDVKLLSDKKFLNNLVIKIAKLLDMKILEGPVVISGIPENPGVTAFAVIDFSHISIHTFTNSREFCLDIFSCKTFDYKKLDNFVKNTFKLKKEQIYKSIVRYDQLEIEREKGFSSPREYLQEYYNKLSKENQFLLEWYENTYAKMKKGGKLLELGGGPTIYPLISASAKVNDITFSDTSKKNLDIIKTWMHRQNSFWDKFINHSLTKELHKTPSKKEIRGRKKMIAGKIKKLIITDIGLNDERLVNKFDIVQSNFCLESSTDDISEYKRMLKNVFEYLKPKGTLLMTALEGAVAYKVKNKFYPAIYLDKEFAKQYLSEAGFKILRLEKIIADNADSSKYHGILLVKATKK